MLGERNRVCLACSERVNEPSLRGLAAPVRPQNGKAVLPRDRQVTPFPPDTRFARWGGTDLRGRNRRRAWPRRTEGTGYVQPAFEWE